MAGVVRDSNLALSIGIYYVINTRFPGSLGLELLELGRIGSLGTKLEDRVVSIFLEKGWQRVNAITYVVRVSAGHM